MLIDGRSIQDIWNEIFNSPMTPYVFGSLVSILILVPLMFVACCTHAYVFRERHASVFRERQRRTNVYVFLPLIVKLKIKFIDKGKMKKHDKDFLDNYKKESPRLFNHWLNNFLCGDGKRIEHDKQKELEKKEQEK